jgi:hypothetical protein
MKRIGIILLIALVVVLVLIQVIDFYDAKLQAGRMWETAAIRPHEAPITVVAAGSVPFDGGEAFYRHGPPESLQSPLDRTDPTVILLGQRGYDYFCVQCHGQYHDGNGTVDKVSRPCPATCVRSRCSKGRTAFCSTKSAMVSPAAGSRLWRRPFRWKNAGRSSRLSNRWECGNSGLLGLLDLSGLIHLFVWL